RDRFPAAPPAAGHIYLYTISEGFGLMHAAAAADQAGMVRWLAGAGADVNARGGYDDATPLHIAAWGNKPGAADALLDSGAGINTPSGPKHRNEPLGWAVVAGSVETFGVLVARGAAIREDHIEDARKGAKGAFLHFNPRRPLEAWRQIAEAIGAR